MRRSQTAIEFIVLASFMFLVIIGFFAVTSSKVLEAQDESNMQTSQDIAELAFKEIEIAKSVRDGYSRVFMLPLTVNGVGYNISIIDNRELIVDYLEKEYIKFLPSNVTGNLSVGANKIYKKEGKVYVNRYAECNDEIDNDKDGDTDLADAGCLTALGTDESNCGDGACEGTESCFTCTVPGFQDCGTCPFVYSFLLSDGVQNMMSINFDGQAILRGLLQQGLPPARSGDDEFIVNIGGSDVAIVNLITGDMQIEGALIETGGSPLGPDPAFDDFVVHDATGIPIAYIDNSGDFYINGTLTQSGNP